MFNKKTTGVKIKQINATNLERNKTSRSAFLVAKVFGVISPKTKIINVTTPEAAATNVAELPKMPITIDVVNEDAPIFTKLLPTKIELYKRSLFSKSLITVLARPSPSWAKFRILILFDDKKAVSEQEKTPDKAIKIKNTIILTI